MSEASRNVSIFVTAEYGSVRRQVTGHEEATLQAERDLGDLVQCVAELFSVVKRVTVQDERCDKHMSVSEDQTLENKVPSGFTFLIARTRSPNLKRF